MAGNYSLYAMIMFIEDNDRLLEKRMTRSGRLDRTLHFKKDKKSE